jgi:uncharacterized iron-regulated protein
MLLAVNTVKALKHIPILFMIIAAVSFLTACQSTAPAGHGKKTFSRHNHANVDTWEPGKKDAYQLPTALNLNTMPDFDDVINELLRKRVIYIGESHDQISHHLTQLEIIKRIHAEEPNIAIGMEFFQQPFQQYMEEFIKGDIDEREFLNKTEFFTRWRIDYRHYRPIILFAREHSIPLVALDVLEEIQRKVGKSGIDSLNSQEKKHLPDDIDRSNKKYREFLLSIYNRHPTTDSQVFDNFIDVQLMRDEAMAQATADFMDKHPDKRMIVLAGGGHLVYGYGIPQRVTRRLVKADSAIVLNGMMINPSPELADFMLLPKPLRLPKAGRLGVIMDSAENDGVIIKSFSENSPAKVAGAQAEDKFSSIDGQTIKSMSDVKYSLLDKKPGDKVMLTLKRKAWMGDAKDIKVEVKLH